MKHFKKRDILLFAGIVMVILGIVGIISSIEIPAEPVKRRIRVVWRP